MADIAAMDVVAEIWESLHRDPKELSPKFFYDQRGSELFEEITRLPEYYLTRTERDLLSTVAPSLTAATLVELGAGSADKTRILLDAMRGSLRVYVPVDVSADFLSQTAARLRAEYPNLHVEPVVADMADGAPRSASLPRPVLYALLGSTIGNFGDDEAAAMLGRVSAAMGPADRLLLGADLVKDPAVIDAAYNDTRGVTAEFNRNMLRVVGRLVGADFHPEQFEHRAFFNAQAGRIEMHLVPTTDLCVTVPNMGRIAFRRGESIRTEISNKYDRARLARILDEAGLCVAAWTTDPTGGYALVIAARGA